MKAALVLEDGSVFEGRSAGAVKKQTSGEVVFNTSIQGYQEILTDPSYKGQIVTMTYPLIGNYGTNTEDVESEKVQAEGFIVRELCRVPSNFRSEKPLDEYLKEHDCLALTDVDTRAITRRIRLQGAMRGIITTDTENIDDIRKKAKEVPSLVGRDIVKDVTPEKKINWNKSGGIKIAVLDCGVKHSILRNLEKRGCSVVRFPASSSAETILESKPNGLVLSNGPGDPAGAGYVFKTVEKLLGKLPIFGICLGHQMLGLALGGKTYKLKFGHHGGNQPVKDLRTGRVSITAQNHGFSVDYDSVKEKGVEVTHINLNDDTVEGMESEKLNFSSVQFHPEAGPGPNDAVGLFDRFMENVKHGV